MLTPRLYMSAFVWLRGPFFLTCTSGAIYSRVPTSAKGPSVSMDAWEGMKKSHTESHICVRSDKYR